MRNKRLLAALLLLTLGLSACGTVPPAETTVTDPICTELAGESLVLPPPNADASFADNLMRLTVSDGNRMVSPYSAKLCLALLANGARGETKQQILDMLQIADLDAFNAEVKELLARYESYAGVMSLETANSLWLNQSSFGGKGKFLVGYQDAMQDFYAAEVREVTDANSVEEVNAWVNDKTHEKIPSILSEEHRKFATALVNAVYFKAAWAERFPEAATANGEFYNLDGSIGTLPFMQKTDSFGYYEGDGVRAVQIDYGRAGENETYLADARYSFSMYVMLCDDPAATLDVDAFLTKNAPFARERVHVKLPKFEMEYSLSLRDILIALGMVDAFDGERADLGAMMDLGALDGNLYVSDALQKTYVKLDENGTEAAAVTAILVKLTSAMKPTEPIEFTADKPFYFAIRDNTSGETLFVGRYETAK